MSLEVNSDQSKACLDDKRGFLDGMGWVGLSWVVGSLGETFGAKKVFFRVLPKKGDFCSLFYHFLFRQKVP